MNGRATSGRSVPHQLGRGIAGLGMLAGRSLFPLVTVIILAGTVVWGPWVTFVLAIAWFTLASLAC